MKIHIYLLPEEMTRGQIVKELDDIGAWLRRNGRQPRKLETARELSRRAASLRTVLAELETATPQG